MMIPLFACNVWLIHSPRLGGVDMQTATKGDKKHAVLFDAGPEEDAWERNVKRLRPDLASVEVIQLSHWHRDHSGECSRDC